MMKREQRNLLVTTGLFAMFVLWTVVICCFDVQAIGPRESSVGFATFNQFFHKLSGVHMMLYTITDWLGLVPLFFVMGFALLGLIQLIKRRSLWRVDYSIMVLGGYYVLVMAAYVLFEVFPLNYRPILINGNLEASYPSSTTMLVMCVIPTAIMQFRSRMKNNWLRKGLICVLIAFTVFMVAGRLWSGVHWFTDIVGGVLLSSGLVMLYDTVVSKMKSKRGYPTQETQENKCQ